MIVSPSEARIVTALAVCRYCGAAGGLCVPICHRPGCVILVGGWWAADPAAGEDL